MAEVPQVIRTGRLAFWLSCGAAWFAWTGMMGLVALEAPSVGQIFAYLEQAAVLIMIMSFAAAVAGALLGLICGSPLSRNYCWVFGAMIGGWIGIAALATMQVSGRWLRWRPNINGDLLITWVWLVSASAGAVFGIIRSRRILGFANASRRMAVIGMLVGLFAGVFASVAWAIFFQFSTGVSAPWGVLVFLSLFIMLSVACVMASLRAERIHASGFPVVNAKGVDTV